MEDIIGHMGNLITGQKYGDNRWEKKANEKKMQPLKCKCASSKPRKIKAVIVQTFWSSPKYIYSRTVFIMSMKISNKVYLKFLKFYIIRY